MVVACYISRSVNWSKSIDRYRVLTRWRECGSGDGGVESGVSDEGPGKNGAGGDEKSGDFSCGSKCKAGAKDHVVTRLDVWSMYSHSRRIVASCSLVFSSL